MKVVGAFRTVQERSDARKYPAIHPLESWSKYSSAIDAAKVEYVRNILARGDEVGQMMKVVGEEGTTTEDYILYLKSEFVDAVYLQQNSFDPVDAAVGTDRQSHVFNMIFDILGTRLNLSAKEEARGFFNHLRQRFLDFNGEEWQSPGFRNTEREIRDYLDSKKAGFDEEADQIVSQRI